MHGQEAHGLAGVDLKAMQGSAHQVSSLLKALANPARLMAVCCLAEGEMAVNALAERIGLSQSALSQHLARLRDLGVVATRREGQTIFYRLDDPSVARLITVLHDEFCPRPPGAA